MGCNTVETMKAKMKVQTKEQQIRGAAPAEFL